MRKLFFLFRQRNMNILDLLGREASFFIIGILFTSTAIIMFLNYEKNNFLSLSLGSVFIILSIMFFLPSILAITRFPVEKNNNLIIDEKIVISQEDKFRDFFFESKFDDLLKLCIQNNLINSDALEWQKEPTHFVVLYHKLRQNNYLKVDKKKYTQKDFATFAKKIFKIDRLDNSLFSHYKPGTTNYISGGYEEFYIKTLSFIGNE